MEGFNLMSSLTLKQRIQQSFATAATDYHHHALWQQQIAQQLVDRAIPYLQKKKMTLDIGSGSGFVVQALQRQDIPVIATDI